MIKAARLDVLLGDLVTATGIDYKFGVEDKERRDVDRCFMMLRDMAGDVKEKLTNMELQGEKSPAVVDVVDIEHDKFEFENEEIERNLKEIDEQIDSLDEISEEKPLKKEHKKRHIKSKDEKRKVKKPKVETKSIIKTFPQLEDEPKADAGRNVFKPEWMDPKALLFDVNGDRLSDYLSPIPSSPSLASCLACRSSFSVGGQGVGQVYSHARGAQHKDSISRLR